jgi:predicted RNA-binding Zn-ribbon protein involved in translation (DUF1610 family)
VLQQSFTMVPREYYLRRLNKFVKWTKDGFVDELGPCSIEYINNNMICLEKDVGYKFKPGFIDASNADSNTSVSEDEAEGGAEEEEEEEEEERSDREERSESDRSSDESDVEGDEEEEEERSDREERSESDRSSDESDVEGDESNSVKSSPSYPCPVCGIRFVFMSQICTHMKAAHRQNPSKLHPSCEPFKSDNACRTVIQPSYDVKPVNQQSISCSDCGQTFANSCNLLRHIKCQHSEKKFKCPACGRAFSRLDNMKFHRRICKKQYVGLQASPMATTSL